MPAESFDDQLARVNLMTREDSKWDLSDNDRDAIKAVLADRILLGRRLQAISEVPCVREQRPKMKCLPHDKCSFCRVRDFFRNNRHG